MTEASIPESAAQQRIDARPWQDPFAAIEKSFDKTDKLNPDQQCLKTLTSSNAQESPLTEKEHETLVIGVMVPGSAYSEDAEHRRQTRFAVFAGLARSGFIPKDSSHIKYFSWPHPAWDKRPSAVPSQVVPAGPPLSADDQAGPSWKRGGGIAQPQQTIVPTNGLNKFRDASGAIKNKS